MSTPTDTAGRAAGAPDFDTAFQDRLLELFRWRRDVRRFRRGAIPAGALDALLEVASLSPSVGLSQPWRFVKVDDGERRRAVHACFARCNAEALASYAEDRARQYASLKLAGLEEAPAHLAVFCDDSTQVGHGLGRRTMPETLGYSVVTAIHTLWLAARAQGLGLGWISILDPDELRGILDVPEAWRFIAYLCIGYPEEAADEPELARAGWEERQGLAGRVLQR